MMYDRAKHIQNLGMKISTMLACEDAGDALTALVEAIGQELSKKCSLCRADAREYLERILPQVFDDVEDFVKEHGEPECNAPTETRH